MEIASQMTKDVAGTNVKLFLPVYQAHSTVKAHVHSQVPGKNPN